MSVPTTTRKLKRGQLFGGRDLEDDGSVPISTPFWLVTVEIRGVSSIDACPYSSLRLSDCLRQVRQARAVWMMIFTTLCALMMGMSRRLHFPFHTCIVLLLYGF